ncbi:MAG: hypothetical protein AAF528_06180 [Cyanobacteria bacterium P01_C01_bin.121]
MLTSSHYLLGGFLAAFCTIGGLLHPSSSATSNLPQAHFEASTLKSFDISYRGSGRSSNQPMPKKNIYTSFYDGKTVISHRGSGRIRPSSI